jgi:NADPH:quinone reductase-like Zn-dependent oxidoreductase
MKASFFRKYGGPEVLEYGDWPDPTPAAGEVLVDVHAASVNAADWKTRAGIYGSQIKLPHVPGRDFSGVVSAVGQGANDFKVGDAVFAVCEVPREGAYAEKIAIRQEIVARKPEGLSHAQAAAIALAGLTALISLEETLKLKAGETILIQGGAGGVAGFAIQLAKHIGARVISTCSTGNLDYVRGLGADEVIDYKTTDFTKVVKDCDAVFETVGDDVALRSFAVLKPGGRATFIASGPTAPKPDRSDVTALRPAVPRERKYIERTAELHGKGAVRPQHVTLFELAKAREALGISAARHFKGKLVLKVR